MTSRSTLTQAVYDELVDAIEDRSDVGTPPEAHVVLHDEDLPESPPALSVRYSEADDDEGGPRETQVTELVTNDSGEVVDIEYAESKTLTVDVTTLANADTTAVGVYEDVRQHFNGFDRVRDPTELATDVDDVAAADSTPDPTNDKRGHILTITVDYEEHFLYSDITGSQLTPARTVEQTIEAGSDSQAFSDT